MKVIKYGRSNILSDAKEIEHLVEMGEEEKVPHLWYNLGSNKDIFITELFTPEKMRGQGEARKIMTFLIKMCQKTGINEISLSPSDCFGSDLEKLKAFYESFGFREEKYNIMTLYCKGD